MDEERVNPQDFGFPPFFTEFREAQKEAIEHGLISDKRFIGIGAPPGVGKSGLAKVLANLYGGRSVILTASHGLENQYMQDFGSYGMVNIRGRANYHCWEGGSCADGARLGCGDKAGCPYGTSYRVQQQSNLVVTNYAYWLSINQFGNGIKAPDTLFLDEAGLAESWLRSSLNVVITERECKEMGVKVNHLSEGLKEWAAAAIQITVACADRITSLKAAPGRNREKAAAQLKAAESLMDRAKQIGMVDESNWVITREDGSDYGREWKFEVIRAGAYRERLFRNIPRVVLLSATLRPKTLALLGIRRDECDFREWGRQFAATNGPVVWVPTVRLNSRSSNEDKERWMKRHGEILEWGSDRNGLCHTVSYARSKELVENHGSRHRILVNGAADPDSRTASEAYRKFVGSPIGTTLVSPSFSTGWDFKGRIAEWQVISKIAFPDTRSKINQAIKDSDPGYFNYLAAQDLVQACGRITRSDEDRGTTLIVDDNIEWFARTAAEFMPRWFKFRREESLPKPLKKI